MKKFCLSYSSGKDCLLAMDRLVQAKSASSVSDNIK